jgi:hypothetical protein
MKGSGGTLLRVDLSSQRVEKQSLDAGAYS